MQLSHKAVASPGLARDDWKIISEVSRLCGYPMNYQSTADIMKEINALTPSYAGITYERIEKRPRAPVALPQRGASRDGLPAQGPVQQRAGHLFPLRLPAHDEVPDEEYDFILTTGRIYPHYHTGTVTRRISVLEREAPAATIEVHPEDAKRLGIRNNDLIEVTSRRGSIKAKAEVTTRVRRRSYSRRFISTRRRSSADQFGI